MSRYMYWVPLENPDADEARASLEIAVGWDAVLETYFAQVVEVRNPVLPPDEEGLPTAEGVVRSHWQRALAVDEWGEDFAESALSKEPQRFWRLVAGDKPGEVPDLETLRVLVAPWAPLPSEIENGMVEAEKQRTDAELRMEH